GGAGGGLAGGLRVDDGARGPRLHPIDPFGELTGRRLLHGELDGLRVLDVVERLRPGREGLVDVLAVDRSGEVERVLARRRRDQPRAVVARRSELALLEEGFDE